LVYSRNCTLPAHIRNLRRCETVRLHVPHPIRQVGACSLHLEGKYEPLTARVAVRQKRVRWLRGRKIPLYIAERDDAIIPIL
jgi:hypothetical protein